MSVKQPLQTMIGDEITSPAEEMSWLQEMVQPGSPHRRSTTVLFKERVQNGEQGVATKAVAVQTNQSELLAR
jgi:hypothetical protein